MDNSKQFFVQRNISWGDTFDIFAREKVFPGPIYYNFISSKVTSEPGEFCHPLLRLSREEAQLLMEELWNSGIRPSGAAGSAGQLAAVTYHLEDMRKLVFNNE